MCQHTGKWFSQRAGIGWVSIACSSWCFWLRIGWYFQIARFLGQHYNFGVLVGGMGCPAPTSSTPIFNHLSKSTNSWIILSRQLESWILLEIVQSRSGLCALLTSAATAASTTASTSSSATMTSTRLLSRMGTFVGIMHFLAKIPTFNVGSGKGGILVCYHFQRPIVQVLIFIFTLRQ